MFGGRFCFWLIESVTENHGPPGPIRTAYPLVRSQVLYPNELRAETGNNRTAQPNPLIDSGHSL